MKIKSIFVIALMAAAILSGCNKDDEKDNNGNNNAGTAVGQNELVYDGTRIVLECAVTRFGDEMVQFACNDKNGGDLYLGGNIDSEAWNHEFNLAQHTLGVHYGFDFYPGNDNLINVNFDNWEEGLHGALGEQGYEGESVFSSGTAKIVYDNDGFTFTVNGVLKNGKNFGFVAHTPYDQITIDPNK